MLESKIVSKTGHSPTRRQMIAAGSAMLLVSCSRSLKREAVSSHAGRRPAGIAPLQFDVEEGFDKLNAVRRKRLLPVFRMDPRLQEAAQRHADMMGARGLYGHEIGPGTDFKSRILAVDYNNTSGENIGVGYASVDAAIEGWLNSPAHRKNMLKARYTIAGLAYAFNISGRNDRYTHFWVLIMGKDDGRS